MIVVDSSALIAILEGERERMPFVQAILKADRRLTSAMNYQEAGQVLFGRRGQGGVQDLDDLLNRLSVEIIPHDASLARLAIDAFQRFGKGIHPQARLNFGDCAAYALAKQTGAPLLFKGEDFAATDIVAALPLGS